MIPGLDPSKMKAMMKQMGIQQEDIDAKRVIIEKEGENIVIENPGVVKIKMQGNVSWQITGEESVETSISDEDINLVSEKSQVDKEKAKEALEISGGDIAQAIIYASG